MDSDQKEIRTVILDTLKIFSSVEDPKMRDDICKDFLGSMLFENPKIIKIFHGAISASGFSLKQTDGKTEVKTKEGYGGDLVWLQRDFGVRSVNIFDT